MTLIKAAFVGLYLASSSAAIALQQTQTPPPGPCKADPAFKAFDFWVGDWNVSGRQNGQHAGENSISKIEGDCALLEEWNGAAGSTGRSINYYNPVTKKWRQLWVSGGAYAIDIEGGLKDGSMVLEGTIWYYASGQSVPFRGTWTPNEDGSVRQFFEQMNAETNDWQPWFDGLYVKKSE